MIGRACVLAGVIGAVLACRDGSRPTTTTALADSADQVLIGMSHYVTAAGVQRARVRADTAFFYSPAQRAILHNVHITFYKLDGGESSTLTSREGIYNWRNGDMEAHGNVSVVTTYGRTLKTESLHYNETKNEVTSDVPFVFDAPDRHSRVRGFVSDPDFRDGRQASKGTGGQFTLRPMILALFTLAPRRRPRRPPPMIRAWLVPAASSSIPWGIPGARSKCARGRPTCSRAAASARTVRERAARSPPTASPGSPAWVVWTCWGRSRFATPPSPSTPCRRRTSFARSASKRIRTWSP